MNLKDLQELLASINPTDSDLEAVDAAVMVYRQTSILIEETIAPHKKLQDAAKEVVLGAIARTGIKRWNKDVGMQNGNAYVAEPYTRVSYDSEMLDAYMKHATPEVKTILKMARKETRVKPSLTIK